MLKRRHLLKSMSAGLVGLSAGGLSIFTFTNRGNAAELTMNAMLSKVEQLNSKNLSHLGSWSPARVIKHCALSIEYSMMGYPVQKSATFKNIIGKPVFAIFKTKRRLSHNLDEPIPGEAPYQELSLEQAKKDFQKVTFAFLEYNKVLKPHFAFGELTKDEYALLHAMHLENHWERFRFHQF
ncbi:MAG: DUF1569 domain-containing protein [Pseudomonadota bacterium]